MRILISILLWTVIIMPGLSEGKDQGITEKSPYSYDDHGKRDPFWHLVNTYGMIVNYDSDLLIADLLLEGIIFDEGGKSMAIINGSIVKEGGKLGQFTISKIKKDLIILLNGGQQHELLLEKEE